MIEHKNRKLALMACLLIVMTATCITTAYAGDGQMTTESIDPGDNMHVYVSISNCAVQTGPTDGAMLEIEYDPGTISMQHESDRGQNLLTFGTVGEQRMGEDAAARVHVPKDTYAHLWVHAEQGDAVVDGGINCGHSVHATDHSNIEVQYAPNQDNKYELGVADNSTMDFIVGESESNYFVRVAVNENCSLNVPQDWIPNLNPRIIMGLFEYTNGNGAMKIDASLRDNSTMNILYAK